MAMKLKLDITPDIVAMMAAEVVAGERAVTRLRPGVELAATVMALRLRDGLLQPADLAAEIDDFAMRAGSRSGQEKAA